MFVDKHASSVHKSIKGREVMCCPGTPDETDSTDSTDKIKALQIQSAKPLLSLTQMGSLDHNSPLSLLIVLFPGIFYFLAGIFVCLADLM